MNRLLIIDNYDSFTWNLYQYFCELGAQQPLTVTRYHSLIIDAASVPSCLAVTAWSQRKGEPDEIMAIRHSSLPLEGVQFHPESIMSEQGHSLLANFLNR